MKRSILTTAIIFLLGLSLHGAKGPDMKYLKEAASKVWSMELPQFDPKADLDNPAYNDVSAVFIATHINVTADRVPVDRISIYRASGTTRIAENNIRVIKRYMVRLNDSKAIEDFSEFSYKPKELEMERTIALYEFKEAFGARIHKPDGRIENIDMSATLTETEGKKDKTTTLHKIAIPGLEVNDVLEFFYLTDQYMLANQNVAFDINPFRQYPTRNCVIDMTLNPEMTTEMNTFNGFPVITRTGTNKDGHYLYHWEENNLPAFDKPRWCAPKRQVPYMRVKISDNESNLFKTSRSARYKGVYVNLAPNIVMTEIAETYSSIELPPKDLSSAVNLVKSYLKTHADATDNEIADAAWLSTLYTTFVSNETYNEWSIAAMFKDVMDKLNTTQTATLAVTSSREEVPIENIASYKQATPMVFVGERPFIYNTLTPLSPGEVPEEYAGETAFTVEGKRAQVFEKKNFKARLIPPSIMNSNILTIKADVTIPSMAGDEVKVSYTNTAKGFHKNVGAVLVRPHDLLGAIETHLEIPEKSKAKTSMDIVASEEKRRDALHNIPIYDFNIESVNVDTAALISPGFMPGENALSYRIDFRSKGLLSQAGEDVILNIGSLIGNVPSVKDEKRERDISIFTAGAYNKRVTLTLTVPEGYAIDPASLDALQANITNRCGMFFAQAAIESDGNLRIAVNRRNVKSVYPPELWEEFLTLHEATASFGNSSIVLHKK